MLLFYFSDKELCFPCFRLQLYCRSHVLLVYDQYMRRNNLNLFLRYTSLVRSHKQVRLVIMLNKFFFLKLVTLVDHDIVDETLMICNQTKWTKHLRCRCGVSSQFPLISLKLPN